MTACLDLLKEFVAVSVAHRTPTLQMRQRAYAAIAHATGRTEQEVAGELACIADDLRHQAVRVGFAGAVAELEMRTPRAGN